MTGYQEMKERVWQANMELSRQGLAKHNFGNASQIDERREFIAIKPSGVPYTVLKPENIVLVRLDGSIMEGELRPSSDTKTHLMLYKNFPDIGGVVHTHSTYAVAWAQARRPIPILGTTHADHLNLDVPCTEVMSDEMIRGDYEEETGHQILNCFKNLSYNDIQMVLVAGHGPFTWGPTVEKAVYNSAVLEELAQMAYLTCQINPQAPRLEKALVRKHYERKHGPNAYYGQK